MRGRIIFDNGASWSFNESNYVSVIASLDDDQRKDMTRLLLDKLGPRTEHEFDQEAYDCWYEDVHRKDVIMGGGSSNSDSKMNKKGGKKFSLKAWKDMTPAEQNLKWSKMIGVKRKWSKDIGYGYSFRNEEVPLLWINNLDHEEFKRRVMAIEA